MANAVRTQEELREDFLQRAIQEEQIWIDGTIIRYVNARGRIQQNYSDPEEQVRALVYSELLYKYEYKPSNIFIELRVELHESKYADIAIFQAGDGNKVFAILELKKENPPKKEIINAIGDQYAYALVKDAQYFVFDCNKSSERKRFCNLWKGWKFH